MKSTKQPYFLFYLITKILFIQFSNKSFYENVNYFNLILNYTNIFEKKPFIVYNI